MQKGEYTPEWFACPNCQGHGAVRGPEYGMPWHDCRYCDGVGLVDKDERPIPYDVAFKAGAV